MLEKDKFSTYSFANINPENANDLEAPRILKVLEPTMKQTGCKKWLTKNLMLLITLFGVLFGVIEGDLKFELY